MAPKNAIFRTENLTCDIPQKAYFFVYPIKRKICYLDKNVTPGSICHIILHLMSIRNFTEHILVLFNKTKHMTTS
jgi:hypothetical protein